MTTDANRRAMLIALMGATAISFSPVLYIFSDTNPSTGAFFRMLYALPALALLAYIIRNSDTRSSRTRWLAFGAGLLLAPDMLVYHSAMIFIGVGIATLIGNSQVIIVTLASWKMFGEKPNPAILISLPIVMIGLALISGVADSNPYGKDPVKGVIFGVMGAFFYSFFLIMFRYANRELAPVASVQFDATAGAAFGLLILGMLPLSRVAIEPLEIYPTFPGHAWLIFLALLCQVVGWLAIAHSLPRLPAAHTSFAILLQPVLTLIWGYLILHQEGYSQNQVLGIFLVLAAITSVTIYGSVGVEASAEE